MENKEQKKDYEHGKGKLPLVIEGQSFDWFEQYITGKQIRELVTQSTEAKLFLAIAEPYRDELIETDEPIDLARPGIEHFYFKHALRFTINGKEHEWLKQYITGNGLKKLGQIPDEDELFLANEKPYKDDLITNNEKVDLARPGIEHFYSKKKVEPPFVTIEVDGVSREITVGEHTVDEIKKVGKVKEGYELDQEIDGQSIPLKESTLVEIKGREIFFSHVKDGKSS